MSFPLSSSEHFLFRFHRSDNFTSPHWKDLGFQSSNPLNDLKRVGILGLRHLSYYGERWPDILKEKIKLAREKKASGLTRQFCEEDKQRKLFNYNFRGIWISICGCACH
jgi:hypothetical protein